MGLFSCDCKYCDHPLLSIMACHADNTWMNEAVVIRPDGELIYGPYDGYGRVGDGELGWSENVIDGSTCYHYACWIVLGRPLEFSGASESSEDQGWFFEDGAHDIPDPRGVRT